MNEKKTNLLFSLNQLNIFCTKDGEGDKERIEEYCKNLKTKGIAAQKEIISKTAVDQRKRANKILALIKCYHFKNLSTKRSVIRLLFACTASFE